MPRMPLLRIEKSAFGGYGLAFHENRAIFVPFTIPGELVETDDAEFRKSVGFANVRAVIEASADRIRPQCPAFGSCGGCDYLHMTYDRELEEKRAIVSDSLTRIGKFSAERIPGIKVLRSERFGCRSHASVKIDESGRAGFYAKDSHDVIAFPEQGCLLLCPELRAALKNPPAGIKEAKAAIDAQGIAHISGEERIGIEETENGITYRRDIRSFFQSNRYLRKEMIAEVLAFADLSDDKTVLDLGCGSGFFTLQAARLCREAHGIDISAESISSAKRNAAANGIANVRFEAKPDDRTHPYNDRADIVIADPPRAGLSTKTKKTITAMEPERIVYVSCNPTTWARDLKEFTAVGYALNSCTLIDMFPGTGHIEVISLLSRN